ncbi:hypothetical protein JG687_00018109 [Phytophthora cactorum]|uniref:Uncharacterized protein n=1 Tax=Phytophthora cactorum TaxID=29920 RepID=A0A8T1TPT0_9STRA|nr:hypothetical protein JG687_00018109 [Phytophthora cactorum]
MPNPHGRQLTDATLVNRVALGAVTVEFSDAGGEPWLHLRASRSDHAAKCN